MFKSTSPLVRPIRLFEKHHQAIESLLFNFFEGKVAIEANRRLVDLVPKSLRPAGMRGVILTKPLAAIGYAQKTGFLVLITVFSDEWRGGERNALNRFCDRAGISFFVLEKQESYDPLQLIFHNAAKYYDLSPEQLSSTILDARCHYCDGPLLGLAKGPPGGSVQQIVYVCVQAHNNKNAHPQCDRVSISAGDLSKFIVPREARYATTQLKGERILDDEDY